MGTAEVSDVPPLPPGFTLDARSSGPPPLPPGFALDSGSPPAEAGADTRTPFRQALDVALQGVKGFNTSLVHFGGLVPNAAVQAYDLAAGTHHELPTDTYDRWADKDVPKPRNALEANANFAGGLASNLMVPTPKAVTAATTATDALATTLAKARASDYVIPPAEAHPTVFNRMVSTLLGRKQLLADATKKNQTKLGQNMTKELGLPEGAEVNHDTLDAVINDSGKAYADIAAISPEYATKVQDIKELRNTASKWYKQSAANYSVEAEEKANTAWQTAKDMDAELKDALASSGQGDKFSAYTAARQRIAKAFNVMKALVASKGEMKASSFAAEYGKDKPLSGEILTAGRTAQAFPKAFNTPQSTLFGPIDNSLLASGPGLYEFAKQPKYAAAAMALALARIGGRKLALSGPMQDMMLTSPEASRIALSEALLRGGTPYATQEQ